MNVSLQRAVVSLTAALDFVGVDETHHGRRVALMAAALAEQAGWSNGRVTDMLYAGMIHDCGVSRLVEHRNLTATLEWEGAEAHCRRGEAYLLDCPPLARFAPLIRWHHTRWERMPADLDDEVRITANLLFLADRLDVLIAAYFSAGGLKNELLWEYPTAVARISELAGTLFAPALTALLPPLAERESFWLALDPAYIDDEIDARLATTPDETLGNRDALAIARLFAHTVDAKSAYTLEHSTRVAAIARYLAERTGFGPETLDRIEIAALLHDIGKLRVPEAIIDKPGPLTQSERAFVQRHSYDTGQILRKVFPHLAIADWAAMHHENLLGTGYPTHRPAGEIPREARLIAVADIFQALSQNRPYRHPMDCAAVMALIEKMVRQGRIDAEMVALLRRHADACYALALR